MKALKGIGVANGIAIGKALLILDEDTVVFDEVVGDSGVEREIEAFRSAVDMAKSQIRAIKDRVKDKIGEEHAFIFDTHILLLEDRTLVNETVNYITKNKCNAAWAFSEVLMNLLKEFSALGDSYFVERGNDLKDVGKRVLKILRGAKEFGFTNLQNDVIIIGSDFGPSNITRFDKPHIKGFASDVGAQTTHTAIIAKALELPAVVGLHDVSKRVNSGDTIILDSFAGKVFVNPNTETLEKYQKLMTIYDEEKAGYRKEIRKPAVSLDGLEIELLANIELPNEADGALENGAQGIGLYRTEFLFLKHSPELPTEAIHYETYCELAEKLGDRPLTIRTLDLGGDKFFHRTFRREKEANPVMGLRGVRLCLARSDIFRDQLRAVLRAAHKYRNIRIMFPLLSGVKEWHSVKAYMHKVMDEMREEGTEFREDPKLGAMIEVPSAAMVSDFLAAEMDFFSIGTNDLLQYFLAIDRANDDVSYLYDPFHPGFVRLLSFIIEAANRHGIDVSCCGEMASSPLYASLLIKLGLRRLSMNPASLPIIHHMIRSLDFVKLENLVPATESVGPTGPKTRAAFREALKTMLTANDYQSLIGEYADD
ncbi:MAG: phosphoenolpyruvate--protein phosphotransferase [Acidobacteriota bacterium]|nr:phosphoenolpyruvate--protein phosphotransferase [Acidobacteriota bacterium]